MTFAVAISEGASLPAPKASTTKIVPKAVIPRPVASPIVAKVSVPVKATVPIKSTLTKVTAAKPKPVTHVAQKIVTAPKVSGFTSFTQSASSGYIVALAIVAAAIAYFLYNR